MNRRLLLNDADETPPVSKFAYFFVFWRNPMFYLSVLMALFSLFAIATHAVWGFTIGTALALVALLMSIWFAAAIVDNYPVPVRHLSSWTKLKGGCVRK